MPCPVPGSSVEERHRNTGASPAKMDEDDQRTRASLIQGEAERIGTGEKEPGEKKAQEGLHYVCK